MRDDPAQLVGRWVHVHEEDDAQHRVFRRAGTPLPPSRGRTQYDIAADLTARRIGPGADDRPIEGGGYRVAFGDLRGPGEAAGELKVAAVSADRLLLARD